MITLKLKTQPTAPLEANSITPDRLLGKTAFEIAALPAFHGNEEVRISDFFVVQGDGASEIVLEGDLTRVKHIGAEMTLGNVTVHGDVGMHLGAGMRGGEIAVHGNAGDWAGAEMRGGRIRITGNAGHGLGGAYRGSPRGMNRGLIAVAGNAGNEVGAFMRRGVIAIGGDVGDFVGAFMIAGSIFVFGQLGARAGAGMKRGTIVNLGGGETPELLPTFRYACHYPPTFMRVYLLELSRLGLPVAAEHLTGYYQRYSGDMTALGKGEILLFTQN